MLSLQDFTDTCKAYGMEVGDFYGCNDTPKPKAGAINPAGVWVFATFGAESGCAWGDHKEIFTLVIRGWDQPVLNTPAELEAYLQSRGLKEGGERG
jgi:hypothetical protein